MHSQAIKRQRLVRGVVSMLLAGGLLSTMTVASPPVVAQESGQAESTPETAPLYRIFEFGEGTLEERGDYIHCVTRVTSSDDSDVLIPSRETCFKTEGDASEFSKAGSALGAQERLPERHIAVHYDGLNFTGATLRVLGTNCLGGYIALEGTVWNNRISSTVNGCPLIAHYDFARIGYTRNPYREILVVGSAREDTTGIGGNLDELSNRVSGVRYVSLPNSQPDDSSESLPVINLIGIEVTQGIQNWLGNVDLVRNKQTVVRAFFETPEDGQEVEVTAELRGHTSEGIDLGRRNPVNQGRSTTVTSNVGSRREQINSSLNFVLPLNWTDLAESETLYLSLEFQDNIVVNCRERLVPTETCSASVRFTEVTPPNIVMVPVPTGDEDTPDSPHDGILREQFARIMSIMPFNLIDFDSLGTNLSYRVGDEILDFGPYPRNTDLNDVIRDLDIMKGDSQPNTVYLGILPGNPGGRIAGRAYLGGDAGAWFTSGVDGISGDETAHFGHARNRGGHELGHILDQPHPGRDPDGGHSEPLAGVCGEGEDWINGAYSYFRYFEEEERWYPALGNLGNDNLEIWGLDTRYVGLSSIEQAFIPTGFPEALAVINPNEVFSFMSYCRALIPDDQEDNLARNQGRWMDAYHHEEIVDMLGGPDRRFSNSVTGANSETSNVSSDMFSGNIILSSSGMPMGVELDQVYSRPRPSSVVANGEYILELRNASGEILQSIPFDVRESVADIVPGYGGSETLPADQKASFAFVITNPPEYTNFTITWRDRLIASYTRSVNSPRLTVTGPSVSQVFNNEDTIDISWIGSDSDEDKLTYRIYYSTDGGESYRVLSLETTDTSKSISASVLEGSSAARIGISVSDGTRSYFSETSIFSVANHAPEVKIEAPSSDSGFSETQDFILDAEGYDIEDGYLDFQAFSWFSSIDGNLGTGEYLVLSAADLSPGVHSITVTGTDRSGMSASDQITIIINLRNTLPEANDDNISVASDEEVLIDVLANDIDIERDVDLSSFRIVYSPSLGFAQIIKLDSGYMTIKYYSNTSGRDTLSYVICEAVSRCDIARVNIEVGLADCTILGTEGDDTLQGTSGDDVICGLGGNDTIDGRDGNDIIRGGLGDDTIYGGAADDIIYGEIGNDLILGHNGFDTIYGGLDDDTIYGGGGNDMIFGGHGLDKLYGESDDDIIEGGDGSDIIHGGRGSDTIRGGDGDDTIRGNAGADTIEPGKGTDTLLGVSREDIVIEAT